MGNNLLLVLMGGLLILGLITLLLANETPNPRPVPQQPTVAVLPFNDFTGVEGLGNGISQLFVSELEKTIRYQMVESSKIREVIQNAGLNGKVITPADALGVGRAVHARYIVLGTATKIVVDDEILTLEGDLQVVRADQGAIVATHQQKGSAIIQGIRITPIDLSEVSFYDDSRDADLVRRAAQDFVEKSVSALVRIF